MAKPKPKNRYEALEDIKPKATGESTILAEPEPAFELPLEPQKRYWLVERYADALPHVFVAINRLDLTLHSLVPRPASGILLCVLERGKCPLSDAEIEEILAQVPVTK